MNESISFSSKHLNIHLSVSIIKSPHYILDAVILKIVPFQKANVFINLLNIKSSSTKPDLENKYSLTSLLYFHFNIFIYEGRMPDTIIPGYNINSYGQLVDIVPGFW
jgi:hypothetical protein